jgi:hypothetical protein
MPEPNSFRTRTSTIPTNAILKEHAFAGEIVLICWHPAIAKALGVSRPPKWDGKIFDRVWQIKYSRGNVTLANLPQMLLYGDAAS